MYERTHPVMIFFNLWRFFYLLIIPVIRGFVSALRGGLVSWVQGAWIDILVVLLIIAFAVVRWYVVTFRYDEKSMEVRVGFIVRRVSVIPWHRFTTVSIQESFYLRPFRAVYLRMDTMGGSYRQADVTLFLNRDKARELIGRYQQEDSDEVRRQFVPDTRSILALSLLTSNSFVGIVFLATFINQSGRLLGREFSDMIIGTFEDFTRTLAFGIPPASAAIAYALLFGWLVGFLMTFMSYNHFTISRRASSVYTAGGMLTFRQYAIAMDAINFLDIRQSITTKILKLYSLYISAIGYGKRRDDITCVIPTEPDASFHATRQLLFPRFILSERQVRPPSSGIMRYIFQPLAPAILIPAAIVVFSRWFPSWTGFVLFTGLMLMVPVILFLLVRIIDFRTGGLSMENGCITIRYSSGFSLHTVIIPLEKIVRIHLRQSPAQSMGRKKNCDVILYTIAEGRAVHRCRNLSKASVEKLLHL